MQAEQFRNILQKELLERCRKNSRYSVRAFAQTLGTNSSTLSQILRGRRALSLKTIEHFSERLGLAPNDWNISSSGQYGNLSLDTFQIISDWYHSAIFELVTLKNFRPEPRWIAKKLGISVPEVQAACERLFRVGLLLVDKRTSK